MLNGATRRLMKLSLRHLLEGLFRRRLVRLAAARARALGDERGFAEHAGDLKYLPVRLALDMERTILRQGPAARLQEILQPRLGIFEPLREREPGERLAIEVAHQRLRGLETAVDVHGAAHRLHRARENGVAAQPTALLLARPEAQVIAQMIFTGEDRQGRAAHQVGPQAAQLAITRIRKALEQILGKDEIEHADAEEFEALVKVLADTAGGERGLQ